MDSISPIKVQQIGNSGFSTNKVNIAYICIFDTYNQDIHQLKQNLIKV